MTAFDELWAELEPIGKYEPTGGYRRFAYSAAELQCRQWFTARARELGLEVELDRNGNLWAWWVAAGVDPQLPALAIGSHLDSVPDGGAFDGPLGVVSSLAAVKSLQTKGFSPTRPIVIAVFADEEGARFGIACAGSRLMTGQLAADRARALMGRDGVTMAEAMQSAGLDAQALGEDRDLLARIGEYVELHIEQGRSLVDDDASIGVATAIWPHGRYRYTFTGVADHAGTTRMRDRRDPMSAFARTVLSAESAARASDSRATFGRIEVEPNGTNAIPSVVRAWLDARAADAETLHQLLADIEAAARGASAEHGVTVTVDIESETPVVHFHAALRDRVRAAVVAELGDDDVPLLPTGAGHDAGILATAGLPTAMLFVRNRTGISHSPREFADRDDCLRGAPSLVAVLQELAG